jgi:phage FluMu protein Com
MIRVVCTSPYRNSICGRTLLKVGADFTGMIEVKCPKCNQITIHRYVEGVADVA